MEKNYHYETVSKAIEELRLKGYSIDFNIKENRLAYHLGTFAPDEFDIVEVYRYEGESDPGDEATVYGIQSTTGIKGILVTGYGESGDNAVTNEILKKLHS